MMRKALTGLLTINALLQFGVAIVLLAMPARAVPAMFGVPYGSRMHMIVAVLGVSVAVSVALLGLAIAWAHRGDAKGLMLATLFGLWSCAAGATLLCSFGQSGGLFDLLRGLVIIALSLACAADLRRRRAPAGA